MKQRLRPYQGRSCFLCALWVSIGLRILKFPHIFKKFHQISHLSDVSCWGLWVFGDWAKMPRIDQGRIGRKASTDVQRQVEQKTA